MKAPVSSLRALSCHFFLKRLPAPGECRHDPGADAGDRHSAPVRLVWRNVPCFVLVSHRFNRQRETKLARVLTPVTVSVNADPRPSESFARVPQARANTGFIPLHLPDLRGGYGGRAERLVCRV